MKKLLSAILALTLILSLAPAALAVDADDIRYAVEGGNIYFDKDTKTVTDSDEAVTAANIPETIDGAAVEAIGDLAFINCKSLTSVTIPKSVKTIGSHAFNNCTSLASITISDGVTSIGDRAFQYCKALTSIAIPGSVTLVDYWAFDSCTSLTDIYYGGTEGQWKMALGEEYVYNIDQVTVHFNSDAPAASQFTDAQPGGAYTAAVEWAVENGYADPASGTQFGTVSPCPRWEVVSILWKAMGSPEPSADTVNPFTDVSESDPYYKAVLWAYETGVTTGTTATTFGPNTTVERGAAVTFIHRAAKTPASTAPNPFTDAPEGGSYTAAILWAVQEDITKGATDTRFNTFAPVERGQMVTFIYRWKTA